MMSTEGNNGEYEGRSICNENSPLYPNVLYLHSSLLLSLKGLFLG